jgi:glycine/D-amino acid oxidase-like deaminating enzyme
MMHKIQKKRIAVIGMGYAGLSLCFHLLALQAGEITLFDRHLNGGDLLIRWFLLGGKGESTTV